MVLSYHIAQIDIRELEGCHENSSEAGQSYRLSPANLWHSRANDGNHPHSVALRVADVGDHLIKVRHGGFA
jgi:hypothetical protein